MSNQDLIRDPKRMIQRRGTLTELQTHGLEHGELGLTEDIVGVHVGVDNNVIKLLDETNVVDNLTTNDSKKVLSAKQGSVLRGQIETIELNNVEYLQNIVEIVDNKQELIIHKGSTPPTDVKLIWQKE